MYNYSQTSAEIEISALYTHPPAYECDLHNNTFVIVREFGDDSIMYKTDFHKSR